MSLSLPESANGEIHSIAAEGPTPEGTFPERGSTFRPLSPVLHTFSKTEKGVKEGKGGEKDSTANVRELLQGEVYPGQKSLGVWETYSNTG